MRFRLFTPSIAVGAAGFLSGVLYNNFPLQLQNVVPSENSNLDIGNNVEGSATDCKSLMKYGLPSYGNIKSYGEFLMSYNSRTKIPDWVMECLTPEKFVVEDGMIPASRNWSRFFEDKSLNKLHRSDLNDYKNSGYDKGHLAAAGNYKYSQESFNSTFVLSNITPQVFLRRVTIPMTDLDDEESNFNQKPWHDLEQRTQARVIEMGSAYVCSGPIYEPREFNADEAKIIHQLKGKDQWDKMRESTDKKKDGERSSKEKKAESSKELKDKISKEKKDANSKIKEDESSKEKFLIYKVIGGNNVAVPTHYFKAILSEDKSGNKNLESYVIPNQRLKRIKLSNYLVPLDKIEQSTGLTIFEKIKPSDLRTINGIATPENEEELERDTRAV